METVLGINATDAAVRLREKLGLQPAELEIIGVAVGIVRFTLVDASAVALAPYCPACPD